MNLYDVTVPIFSLYLENLVRIIGKAKRYAKKNKISEKRLFEGRLAPDMFTFMQQIGYAYFMALETTTNLSGTKAPEFDYGEKNLSELQKSLRKAISFLKSVPRGTFEGSEKKRIVTFLDPDAKINAQHYTLFLALPNFFFHVTTAYDILRHRGVPLGKDDYLG